MKSIRSVAHITHTLSPMAMQRSQEWTTRKEGGGESPRIDQSRVFATSILFVFGNNNDDANGHLTIFHPLAGSQSTKETKSEREEGKCIAEEVLLHPTIVLRSCIGCSSFS